MTIITVLWVLAALQIKHMLADFWWQTDWMVQNKGRYGHPAALAHAGLHGALTLLVLLGFAIAGPLVAICIAVAEFVVHFHIDWSKERILRNRNPDITDRVFWRAIGVDQLAHQLTYIVIVGIAYAI